MITPALRAVDRNPAALPRASRGATRMAAEVFGDEKKPLPSPSTSRPRSRATRRRGARRPQRRRSLSRRGPFPLRWSAGCAPVAEPAAAARAWRRSRPRSGRRRDPRRSERCHAPAPASTGSTAKQDISVPVLSSVAVVAAAKRGLRSSRPSITGRRAISSVGTSSSRLTHATENHTAGRRRPPPGRRARRCRRRCRAAEWP